MFQSNATTKRLNKHGLQSTTGWSDYKREHRVKPTITDSQREHDAIARQTGIACPHGKPVFKNQFQSAKTGNLITLQACDCSACGKSQGYITMASLGKKLAGF